MSNVIAAPRSTPTTTTDNAGGQSAVEKVPFIDIKRTNGPLVKEIAERHQAIYESGWFVLGPEIQELETTIAAVCGVKHGIACASGSDALLLALMAYDIGPGDEVIVPSFTFFATVSAVTRLGATPVFVDIDPHTYNVCPESVAAAITEDTKAIIPVHLFGQCAEMAPILAAAETKNVPVVEDAAQAIAASYFGRPACSMGDIGCLSFYPTKNLGAFGDAGMLVTNDDVLADKLSLLRVHGMRPRYYHGVVGINSRLDAFQGSVLNVKARYLHEWTQMRREAALRYDALLQEAGLDTKVGLPQTLPGRFHVWNQYTLRIPDGRRDELRSFLNDRGVGNEVFYPVGLHKQECFRSLGYGDLHLPHSEAAGQEVMQLPMFAGITAAEQQRVAECLAEFYR